MAAVQRLFRMQLLPESTSAQARLFALSHAGNAGAMFTSDHLG